jgi:hypothetical protein
VTILDDSEFYESAEPFAQHEYALLGTFVNQFLYRAVWGGAVLGKRNCCGSRRDKNPIVNMGGRGVLKVTYLVTWCLVLHGPPGPLREPPLNGHPRYNCQNRSIL